MNAFAFCTRTWTSEPTITPRTLRHMSANCDGFPCFMAAAVGLVLALVLRRFGAWQVLYVRAMRCERQLGGVVEMQCIDRSTCHFRRVSNTYCADGAEAQTRWTVSARSLPLMHMSVDRWIPTHGQMTDLFVILL